jgi:serine protease 23
MVFVLVIVAAVLSLASGNDEESHTLYWEKASTSGDRRHHKLPADFLLVPSSYDSRRIKRNIFPPDDRVCISSRRQAKEFPFSAIVKVSTGCTGTLIAKRHVLTAAHCIHNGSDYLPGHENLTVGFLRPGGKFRWFAVRHTYLPYGWLIQRKPLPLELRRQIGRRYDYAILRLKKKLKRRPIPLGVSELELTENGLVHPRVFFTSYPDDKPSNSMCYRSCEVDEHDHDLLYFRCDAQPGSSGAGVYAFLRTNDTEELERRVVGVFTGTVWKPSGTGKDDTVNYNVAVRFPYFKYEQLCTWIDGLGCKLNDTNFEA